jgi:hypothetical protein
MTVQDAQKILSQMKYGSALNLVFYDDADDMGVDKVNSM